MPRQARAIVPGFPSHIVQRGHNRQPVFVERRTGLRIEDREPGRPCSGKRTFRFNKSVK